MASPVPAQPDVYRPRSLPQCRELLGTGDQTADLCPEVVEHEGHPCPVHAPANAAALGRCANDLYPYDHDEDNPQKGLRMCPSLPEEGSEFCAWHQRLCRFPQAYGQVCARLDCTAKVHNQRRR